MTTSHTPRHTRIQARTILLAALLLGAPACGEPDPTRESGPIRRDSAGIQLVEYPGLPPLGFGGWTVDPAPQLSVGTMEGPEEAQLYRVSGGARLADGRIAVANGGSGDLRFFGPDGAYLRTEGRRGEGPGEYERPSLVGLFGGDTLVVGDFQTNRVSLVHVDSGFVRSFPANEGSGFGFTHGVLGDGTILRGGGIFFGSGDELASGFQRDEVGYEIASPEGALQADLGAWPGPEMRVDVGEGFISAMSVPFSRNTLAVAGGTRIAIGSNDTYTLHEFAPSGALIRIIRALDPLREVTEAMADAAFEERIADADDEDEVRRLRAARSEEDTPPTLPAFQSILVDRTGLLWVGDYRTPLDADNNFTVFDGEGTIVARLTLPEDLSLLDVGMEYVMGRVTDDFGVEYIHVHRLSRGP